MAEKLPHQCTFCKITLDTMDHADWILIMLNTLWATIFLYGGILTAKKQLRKAPFGDGDAVQPLAPCN